MARNVLAISYATRVLETGSREQSRLLALSAGLDQHVMIVVTNKSAGLPDCFMSGNLSVYATQSSSKLGKLMTAIRLARQVLQRQGGQWVVSAQDPFETGLVAWVVARWYGQSLHIQLHGDNFGNAEWIASSLLNRIRAFWGRLLFKRAASVRVVAQRQKEALLTLGLAPAKIVVLPVQVDLSAFLMVGEERSYTARDAAPAFLYVGRFSPEKDIRRMLTVFRDVLQELPDATLTLLGDGPERSVLAAQVQSLGIADQVRFQAWTNDVPGVMRLHDAFILFSQHEGFALVLLEAMAAGLPIITTDVGCVGDVCLSDKHCLVVPHYDNDTALDTWLRLATNAKLRQRLGRAGYQAVQEFQFTQSDYRSAWTDSFFPSQ